MMRRLWAAIAAAFSVAAVFTVLAFAQRPASPAPAASAQIVMARTANGKLVPVPVAPSGSVHATTQTSPEARTRSMDSTAPARDGLSTPEPCVPVWTAPATEMCGSDAMLWMA